jgi:2-oxoglutarate dehydrogenase E2 component (dihydrolipoamide succinyltransferase)
MKKKITVPPLGESVREATIAKWHKKQGDTVKMDELLVELETDKVTLEVNSPSNGILSEVIKGEGTTVSIGDELGTISEGGNAGAVEASGAKGSENEAGHKNTTEVGAKSDATKVFSPAASKLASEGGVKSEEIQGSGKDGRITKPDVMGAITSKDSGESRSYNVSPDAEPKGEREPRGERESRGGRETRVKMTRLRKTIAARLKQSQNEAAILSTFNEVDMSQILEIRKEYQEKFMEKHGVKLGFMSFFIKAAVIALKAIPAVNAEIDGDDIVYKNYYDIGVAVGTDKGLVVPVLRDADHMTLGEIEKSLLDLSKKARDAKLSMSDMSGASFSITNGGVYGSLLSTPIINPPQSGILGMHNIVERPIAVKGEVVVRPMMYIALSYDHRIIDGKEAVTFLVAIKNIIEDPRRIFLDI